jgi:superfamily II DNA/RNA helicase
MTFMDFSFDKRISACVHACGYVTPTPIQSQTIPLILQGHDVMGLAQTGTGKTAAFALPILQRLLTHRSTGNSPKALILAPTRELALQINENFTAFARKTGIRSSVVIGGVAMGPQIRALGSSQIIVACPGRLVSLIAKKAVNLRAIDTLVLDEADRMLDMGFMPDIKRVLAKLPAQRQNLLFSATMPNSIRAFARGILNNPKTVKINTTSPVTSIEHTFYKTRSTEKAALLEELIQRPGHQNMLIFTRTKHKAKALARKLLKKGYTATFLQGNMSQGQREKALTGFRTGRFPIMVATDIAARGIDCDLITHVVNFDMPDTAETYTHRTGRTGRAGRSGAAISLVTPEDIDQLKAIGRTLKITFAQQSPNVPDTAKKTSAPNTASPGHKTKKKSPRRRRRKSQRLSDAA